MRFDDLQPVELPPPGAILAEWCDTCRAVVLQRVTHNRGRECAACLLRQRGALDAPGKVGSR